MATHRFKNYSVTVGSDGSIQVKRNDWISKYYAAIKRRDVGPIDVSAMKKDFARRIGATGKKVGTLKSFERQGDVNKISVGETIYHIPTYRRTLGTRANPIPANLRSAINADYIVQRSVELLMMILTRKPGLIGPYSPNSAVLIQSIERQVKPGQYFVHEDDQTIVWKLMKCKGKNVIVPANTKAEKVMRKQMGDDWELYQSCGDFHS